MTTLRCVLAASSALALALHPAWAQQAPPIRNLGPIVATSREALQNPVLLRGLSNGNVLVVEAFRRRVVLLDSTLSQSHIVVDSTTASISSSLIPFRGDSTLFVDLPSLALLVIDEQGKVARTISLPKAADIYFVAGGLAYGTPVADAKGRLIYRATFPRVPGVTPYGVAVASAIATFPDSAPIVRADFETRAIDTVALLEAVPSSRTVAATLDTVTRRMTMHDTYNPYAPNDDWIALGDGSIAIIRAHDYHVDFINPDGTPRSTPKLPYQWRPLGDSVKHHMVDSLRPLLEEAAARTLAAGVAIQTVSGLRRLAREIVSVPIDRIPDYEPPFVRGTSKADTDGNLWLLPTTAVDAPTGLLYDIVNTKGELFERVRLPAGRSLAGFGAHGIVYLLHPDGGATHLEVAHVR